ncbi:MAG: hypothetical protein AB4426_33255 [Xenococcaceae cyanobacterium]
MLVETRQQATGNRHLLDYVAAPQSAQRQKACMQKAKVGNRQQATGNSKGIGGDSADLRISGLSAS